MSAAKRERFLTLADIAAELQVSRSHAITRRRVAMKFLKGVFALGSDMHQRFFREARAASLVRHPNVVEVLDVFELDDGMPVMVMEHLVGETLGAKLARERTLPVAEVVALALPSIDAVASAHARGIVHRDLKPDNIFLEAREGGQVIVKGRKKKEWLDYHLTAGETLRLVVEAKRVGATAK